MNISEKAVALHKEQGYNCAQSVLCAVAEALGIEDENLRAIAAGFGGGMRCGEACGALSGAVMATGLFSAQDGQGGVTAPVADCARDITAKFNSSYGYLRCSELLKANGGKKRCPEFIGYCAEAALALAEDKNK